MTTAATSLLGLALPVTGELSGTWGDTVNNSITSLLDSAVAGTTTISTDGDVTLTTTTLAANQAREAILLFSGARTALRTITAPAQSKIYTVINATTGGFAVKLVGAGPTTGVTIAAGESAVIAWNGSDFIKISNTGGTASFTNVTISGTTTLSGLTASTALALDASKNVVSVTNTGTGNNVLSASPTLTGTIAGVALTLSSDLTLSGGTANGVAYLNGSKVLTTGSALTFDGTTFVNGSGGVRAGTNSGGGGVLSAWGGASGATIDITPNTVSGGNGVTYNTSFISGGSGPHIFSIGGSEQMRLTSTGLGIGTSSPSGKLTLASLPGALAIKSIDDGAYFSFWNTANTTRTGYIQFNASAASSINVDVAQALTFGTNNAERMRLDSSGNLGLGVTPSAWSGAGSLQLPFGNITGNTGINLSANSYYNGGYIYVGTGASTTYVQSGGSHIWYNAPSGTAGNAISFTQAMTLAAGGNLLVGSTIDSGSKLQIGSGGGSVATPTAIELDGTYATTSGYNKLKFYLYKGTSESYGFGLGASSEIQYWAGSSSTGAHVWYTSQTERARIDASGNLLVGTTAVGSVAGNCVNLVPTSAGAYIAVGHNTGTSSGNYFQAFYYAGTAIGSITQSGTTAVLYNVISDQRLKENIIDAPEFGSVIDLLTVRSYDWKVGGAHQRAGFIAQELVTVAPEAVHQPADPEEMMAVDYSKLVPMLVKEIQSLRKRLAAAGI